MKGIADDASPRFLYALTNFNHGPHSRKLVAPGQFEGERAFAAASLPDAYYAEYYARLVETAATWNRLKAELASRFPRRPTLIVHYGDHQPVMTRRIEKKLKLDLDPKRQFRTFYAIETLNDFSDRIPCGRGPDLDIAFLGTVALQHAGLPLDRDLCDAREPARAMRRRLLRIGLGTETPLPPYPCRSGHDRRGAGGAIATPDDIHCKRAIHGIPSGKTPPEGIACRPQLQSSCIISTSRRSPKRCASSSA